jgi:hypothetical protein
MITTINLSAIEDSGGLSREDRRPFYLGDKADRRHLGGLPGDLGSENHPRGLASAQIPSYEKAVKSYHDRSRFSMGILARMFTLPDLHISLEY